MRKYKRLNIFFLFLFALFCGATTSLGVYNAENKTVNSGESFSITVTSSTAIEAYNLDLSD